MEIIEWYNKNLKTKYMTEFSELTDAQRGLVCELYMADILSKSNDWLYF